MATLTQEQISIIKSTVPVLQQHGNAITKSFYGTLLKEQPALNNVFNRANQVNNHQPLALANALYAYASNIDNLGALSPAVEKMCQKHASLYIQPEQYNVVGEYLLRAMGDVLGAALTPEILEAWGAAYWQLANIMKAREETLYKESEGWTDWREFQIAQKVQESDEITSFYLKPVDGKALPSFKPGQYISILTDVPRLHHLQSRQYSLSDAPNPDYYRISVKREDGTTPDQKGYISNVLHDEKEVGDMIKVSHPAGEFFLDKMQIKNSPVVLLSAGVGITPMVSILNTLISLKSRQPISFIHGSRTTRSRAFHEHVRGLSQDNENIRHISFIRNPSDDEVEGKDYDQQDRLKLDKLDPEKDLHLDNPSTQYYVCGPDSFMADVEKGLMEKGVEQSRIHMEVFGVK